MKQYREKPAAAGTLIPADAAADLARQDAERLKARERAQARGYEGFRRDFAQTIAYDFEMAGKWGAEADTVNTGWGEEVMPGGRISDKYPPRVLGKFETWLCSFKNRNGFRIFQREPRLNGFIFNEGGRGLTLTVTRMVPFRLYLAGWVLTRSTTGKWTFASRRSWENSILKKLGWVRR